VREALACRRAPEPALVERALFAERFLRAPEGEALLALARAEGVPAAAVADSIFDALADTKSPQGALAVVRLRPQPIEALAAPRPSGAPRLLVLMDGLQDPGNVGAVVRTAAAAGFRGAVLTEDSADLLAPKALRATMGAAFRMPHARCADAAAALRLLSAAGFRSYAACAGAAASCFGAGELAGDSVIVVGQEGAGVSPAARAACDRELSIPMPGGAESLNAAIAASILIYEAVRKNNFLKFH